MSTQPFVDVSFIKSLSTEPEYLSSVIEIFIDTMGNGLKKLEALVTEWADFEAIGKQAHFLKSSAVIIKIKDVHENLMKIEHIAKREEVKDDIKKSLVIIQKNYKKGLPELKAHIKD